MLSVSQGASPESCVLQCKFRNIVKASLSSAKMSQSPIRPSGGPEHRWSSAVMQPEMYHSFAVSTRDGRLTFAAKTFAVAHGWVKLLNTARESADDGKGDDAPAPHDGCIADLGSLLLASKSQDLCGGSDG